MRVSRNLQKHHTGSFECVSLPFCFSYMEKENLELEGMSKPQSSDGASGSSGSQCRRSLCSFSTRGFTTRCVLGTALQSGDAVSSKTDGPCLTELAIQPGGQRRSHVLYRRAGTWPPAWKLAEAGTVEFAPHCSPTPSTGQAQNRHPGNADRKGRL